MNRFIPPSCHCCPSRGGPLLSCCSTEELDLIASTKRSHEYRKGDIIFREGGSAAGLYCVHRGRIKVIKTGDDGKEQIVRLVKDGDVLCLRAVLADSCYTTSAIALDTCVVCFVPRADCLRLLQSNSQFAHSVMKALASALSEAETRMLQLAYKPVRERLALALLLLQDTFQQPGPAPFSMAISREDLASLVGTAKETAIRLLSDFKEAGIISTHGSHIALLVPERLRAISQQYA